jgi:hypothetical protein
VFGSADRDTLAAELHAFVIDCAGPPVEPAGQVDLDAPSRVAGSDDPNAAVGFAFGRGDAVVFEDCTDGFDSGAGLADLLDSKMSFGLTNAPCFGAHSK